MASSFLRPSRGASRTKQTNGGPILSTKSEKTTITEPEWRLLGSAEDSLLSQLQSMYWAGVGSELLNIIDTLKDWQQQKLPSSTEQDELDDFIHGFDTFVDQVSESSRDFATKYQSVKSGWKYGQDRKKYVASLSDRGHDVQTDRISSSIKKDVRKTLAKNAKSHALFKDRARMLLQGAGFLDIDKMIEHQSPGPELPGARPAMPQLTTNMHPDRVHSMPEFIPMKCSSCQKIIRGCSFSNTGSKATTTVCETCYTTSHRHEEAWIKTYKHCVLDDITPEDSWTACQCTDISKVDANGNKRSLIPVQPEDSHVESINGSSKCGILQLPQLVAEAKYKGMLSEQEAEVVSARKHGFRQSFRSTDKLAQRREQDIKAKVARNLRDQEKASPTHAAIGTVIVGTPPALLVREDDDLEPYRRMNMALRIGPLVIENICRDSAADVLITQRGLLAINNKRVPQTERTPRLGLKDGQQRTLSSQEDYSSPYRNYKLVLKQVIGGAFSGLWNKKLEEEIIKALLSATEDKSDKTIKELQAQVQELLSTRVDAYLGSIVSRLLDQNVHLAWDLNNNNCMQFCDKLIDSKLFGSFVGRNKDYGNSEFDTYPLYLMSFVSNAESFMKNTVKTKHDVPNGFIQEYILEFRYGRYNESSITDSLQEYWYDWGAFNGSLYQYQDLFPWDCTEAHGRYPTKCGDCNLAKHVWAFPFDSWSIASLHLTKDRDFYPPTFPGSTKLNDQEWLQNRLTALVAQDKLLKAAIAMANLPAFQKTTAWLTNPKDAATARLKFGGIHRAQLFSHHHDLGVGHERFIAKWAHLTPKDKRVVYEEYRNKLAKSKDIGGHSVKAGYRDPYNYYASTGPGTAYDFFYVATGVGAGGGFEADAACAAGCAAGCGSSGAGCGASCGGGACGSGCGGGGGGCGAGGGGGGGGCGAGGGGGGGGDGGDGGCGGCGSD